MRWIGNGSPVVKRAWFKWKFGINVWERRNIVSEQLIITLSREFGSAGHVIAERIAKDHGLNFYDRHILDEIATENNMKVEVLEKYD